MAKLESEGGQIWATLSLEEQWKTCSFPHISPEGKLTVVSSLAVAIYIYLLPRKLYSFWYPKPVLNQKWKQEKNFRNKQPYFFLRHNLSRPITLAGELTHAITHTTNGKQQWGRMRVGSIHAAAHHFRKRGEPLSSMNDGVSTGWGGLCRGGGPEDALGIRESTRMRFPREPHGYIKPTSQCFMHLKKILLTPVFEFCTIKSKLI